MQQVYKQQFGVLPPASLIKAILFNCADDIFKAGPDYKTGYGLLNTYKSVGTLLEKKYAGGDVAKGATWTYNFTIPDNVARLKVMLCWNDSNANPNDNISILNDLDLEVIQKESGRRYLPYVLSNFPEADSLSMIVYAGIDSLNTSEQVRIERPQQGVYQVAVKGRYVLNNKMPFHIAFEIDTLNTFQFLNPLDATDVLKGEQSTVNIQWETHAADTSAVGELSYLHQVAVGN